MRLKYREIATYRALQLEHQHHQCGLCGEVIDQNPVLDHDHKTGLIRQVLHRGCNLLLGKIENNMARNHISVERLQKICDHLIPYITDCHTDVIHPTHKEPKMKAYKKKGKTRPPKRY